MLKKTKLSLLLLFFMNLESDAIFFGRMPRWAKYIPIVVVVVAASFPLMRAHRLR